MPVESKIYLYQVILEIDGIYWHGWPVSKTVHRLIQAIELKNFKLSQLYYCYTGGHELSLLNSPMTHIQKLNLNPLTAKLSNLNFHPLEVVSR